MFDFFILILVYSFERTELGVIDSSFKCHFHHLHPFCVQCLVIGQIACEKMFVVLNKVDMLPPEKKKQQIEKVSSKRTQSLWQITNFPS